MSYTQSQIWKRLFQSKTLAEDEKHKAEKLSSIFSDIRNQVSLLVGEISIDLSGFTVHDISHVDALWSSCDQIISEEYQLNPLEGFILGCAFLFHDAGMSLAAYPGGIKEVKETNEWKRIWEKLAPDISSPEAHERLTLEFFCANSTQGALSFCHL
ncbi:hypothetical protein KX729_31585 [Rhizobium sp. XQZ8]|uniref:HD domain-containing protein n=1 Tax=Rhizobium populisoli TaxID=2859785 RepID=UPI001CA5BE3A|nr:hypothetical protein [Rhizobium populisoli]MBW6425929.1 hypothetical protein [Rhizobium populisoli]